MSYAVYENDKPAEIIHPRYIDVWGHSTFNTKREAEIYAYLWCYPVTRDEAEKSAPAMEIGKKYDYSMFDEVPVWMHIEEHS